MSIRSDASLSYLARLAREHRRRMSVRVRPLRLKE